MKTITRFFSLVALLLAAAGFTACSSDSIIVIDQPEVTKQASYEAVDLGITVNGKKILWANKNVGADIETDYGDYFAFGATEPWYSSITPKNSNSPTFTWKTGKTDGYEWCNTPYYIGDGANDHSWSKYATRNAVLEASDDAAHVNMGGDWYMPTYEEWEALTNNCTWAWQAAGNSTFGGVAGYKVTSKVDSSKSIFLPAAGYCGLAILDDGGMFGYYWSATVQSSETYRGKSLRFGSLGVNPYNRSYRRVGMTVRGVIRR